MRSPLPPQLVLIRHAEAVVTGAVGDRERPLNATGLAQAPAIGTWVQQLGWRPARVLCSPAKRTRQTLACIMQVTGPLPLRLEPALYEATTATLQDLIHAHRDVECLVMVAHNPGVSQLASLLLGTAVTFSPSHAMAVSCTNDRPRLASHWAP